MSNSKEKSVINTLIGPPAKSVFSKPKTEVSNPREEAAIEESSHRKKSEIVSIRFTPELIGKIDNIVRERRMKTGDNWNRSRVVWEILEDYFSKS